MGLDIARCEDELSDLRNLIGTAKDELSACLSLVAGDGIDGILDYAEAVDYAEAELTRLQRLYAQKRGKYRSALKRRQSAAIARLDRSG